MEDENLKKYFPDLDPQKKAIKREYFFNIINSVYPQNVKKLIQHAQDSRIIPDMNEEKKDYILISDEFYNKLMQYPFISRKPGKTVQLLKESTKIYKAKKQKMKKELGVNLKRFKGMHMNEINSEGINESQPYTQLNDMDEEEENSIITGFQRQQTFRI